MFLVLTKRTAGSRIKIDNYSIQLNVLISNDHFKVASYSFITTREPSETARALTQVQAKVFNHGFVLNISKEIFIRNIILRTDNAV